MSEIDIVKDRAYQVLTIQTPTSNLDTYLWQRAQRLVGYTGHISCLPELAQARLQIDHFCLTAATYFNDAGLASWLKAKNATTQVNANSDELLERSTHLVEEKLSGVIEKAKIEKVNRIIIESGSHSTRMTEAMILSDARNLDDTGLTGIFNELRQQIREGKGICDALQSWKNKIDYQYWQARLKKSFRFEQVRKVAEQRLAAADYIMGLLKVETNAQDLEALFIGQKQKTKDSQLASL